MRLLNTLNFIAGHPLSRGRRLRNLFRFAAWQLRTRLLPGPVVVDFVNGAKLLVARGMTGATGNIYVGLHEFEEMAFLLHFLRAGDLFVDVGANVGSYTVLAGAAAGAQCIAFEPDPAAFAWLCRNIELNSLNARVDARQNAVGGRMGEATFSVGADTTNRVLQAHEANAAAPAQTVRMITLDEALQAVRPAVLKIDVEGYETEVIRGASATLAQPELRCVLMERIGAGRQYGFDEQALATMMRQLGFEEFTYAPFERTLKPRAAANNVIFVRDSAFVRERLRSAKPFVVQGRAI